MSDLMGLTERTAVKVHCHSLIKLHTQQGQAHYKYALFKPSDCGVRSQRRSSNHSSGTWLVLVQVSKTLYFSQLRDVFSMMFSPHAMTQHADQQNLTQKGAGKQPLT